jgi:signal peptidase I
MVPTFENNEYLIVDEISYRIHEPERGDVIIFRYPKDPSKFFIKRIIGLPGETLTINGQKITVKNESHPEGFTVDEPYVKNQATNELTVTLPEGQYFVMGDNRSASSDSRVWGNVPEKNIIGRAFLRVLPIAEASVLPGDYKQTN